MAFLTPSSKLIDCFIHCGVGMERDSFISEFNRLYSKGEPFLFITDFEQTDHILLPLEKAADMGILYNFRGATNHMDDGGQVRQPDIRKYPVDFNSYAEAFTVAQKRQVAGDSYLLNLTFPTKIEIDMDFSEIFTASNAEYKLKYKDDFVFFFP